MDALLHSVCVQTVLAMAAAFVGFYFLLRQLPRKPLIPQGLPVLLAAATIVWLAVSACAYLFTEAYIDYTEPQVASLAALAVHGTQPLFTALDDPRRYSLLYGPMVYLLNAVPLFLLGPGMAASKCLGVLLCLGSLIFLYLALAGYCTRRTAFVLTGLAALQYLIFANQAYWDRPDSFLIMCAALALFAAARLDFGVATVVIAVLAGIAVDLKIHGGLYLAPSLLLLSQSRLRVVHLLMIAVLATVVALLPFSLPFVSLPHYLHWLRSVLHQGMSLNLLAQSLTVLAPLALPLLVLTWIRRNALVPPVSWYLVATAFATVLVTVVSCKPGSGAHHYLPLIPDFVMGCALLAGREELDRLFEQDGSQERRLVAGIMMAALAGLLPLLLQGQAAVMHLVESEEAVATHDQVDAIIKAYPGKTLQMGYADNAQESRTFARALLVFAGNPLMLDESGLMDMNASGLPLPGTTSDLLRRCSVDAWIIPKGGEPFSIKNDYPPHKDLFDAEFRKAFLDNYQIAYTTPLYNVWECRGRRP